MNRDRFNLFFRKKGIGFFKHGLGDIGFGAVIDSAKVNTYCFDQERSYLGSIRQERSNVITKNKNILNVYKFLLQFKNLIPMMKLSHNYMWREANLIFSSLRFAPLITPKVTWRLCKWKNIKRRSLWLLESTIKHGIWLLTGNFCKKVTLFDNYIQFVRRGLAMCVAATKHCIYLLSGMIRVILDHLSPRILNFTGVFSFKESL
ncbi:MAG: hypothetical protein HRT87_05040 [Legionellales bacterium]|nr:hypothetical protein [Legionellales bacterium]